MSQYILLNRIEVQGANAVSGFTWGYPAITHFLGFTHNLHRKLNPEDENKKPFTNIDIDLSGCAVIAHHQQIHSYRPKERVESPKGSGKYIEIHKDTLFIQSRNPAYQKGEDKKNKVGTPPIIEEGKMDLTVSLLIKYDGYLGGNQQDALRAWLGKTCLMQRLAGGTVLDINSIDFFTISDSEDRDNQQSFRFLIRKLLPGFILKDQSKHLEKQFLKLKEENEEAELFDAWLDFITLKQKARPVFNLISVHLEGLAESEPESYQVLLEQWQSHLDMPYEQATVSENLKTYFSSVPQNEANEKLLKQWQDYCSPTEKTDAVWEYIKKPKSGYLVPIMIGYKAISDLYKNPKEEHSSKADEPKKIPFLGARDNKTDVCFVEAVHSIGEWQGIHRIKNIDQLDQTIWQYDDYRENWYLCKQGLLEAESVVKQVSTVSTEDDFSQ